MAHRHTAASTSDAWAFAGAVSRDENRAAHGNVGFTERCSCGYQRHILVNQRHEEHGPWHEGPKLVEARLEREVWARRCREAAEQADALRRGIVVGGGVSIQVIALDVEDPLVTVRIQGQPPQRVSASLIHRAASDWSDLPESSPALVYGSISDALARAKAVRGVLEG